MNIEVTEYEHALVVLGLRKLVVSKSQDAQQEYKKGNLEAGNSAMESGNAASALADKIQS